MMALTALKVYEREIVYDLPEIDLISQDFLAALVWPENIRMFRYFLSGHAGDEFKATAILASKYQTLVVYSAGKEEFRQTREVRPESCEAVEISEFPALKKVYIETNDRYHDESGRPLTPKGQEERDLVLEKLLPGSRNICLKRSGAVVGLLVIVKWKDCFHAPVDWIPWVWVDKTLSFEERKWAHSEYSRWLKMRVTDRVQCIVESDNFRSRKFFVKLGFHPECLVILKEKQ